MRYEPNAKNTRGRVGPIPAKMKNLFHFGFGGSPNSWKRRPVALLTHRSSHSPLGGFTDPRGFKPPCYWCLWGGVLGGCMGSLPGVHSPGFKLPLNPRERTPAGLCDDVHQSPCCNICMIHRCATSPTTGTSRGALDQIQ